MPTMNPFTVLGHFAVCPSKVRADTYDNYVTLGGFGYVGGAYLTGSTPTATEIDDSLQNALKLYWLLHKVNFKIHGAPPTYEDESIDSSNDIKNLWGDILGNDQPEDRQCQLKDSGGLLTGDYGNCLADEANGPNGTYQIAEFYGTNGGIVRMYKGVTTDENNFIGYGIKSSEIADVFGAFPSPPGDNGLQYIFIGPPPDLQLYACSYLDDYTPGFGTLSVGKTEISGIPFCGFAYALGDTAESVTITDSEFSASGDDHGAATYKAQIVSLEFYTAP